MAKATKNVKTVQTVTGVTLELSEAEAKALRRVLGQVSGFGLEDEPYRIYDALCKAKVPHDDAYVTKGGINITHPDRKP